MLTFIPEHLRPALTYVPEAVSSIPATREGVANDYLTGYDLAGMFGIMGAKRSEFATGFVLAGVIQPDDDLPIQLGLTCVIFSTIHDLVMVTEELANDGYVPKS